MMRPRDPNGRPLTWFWIAAGVSWGLLCVGVRIFALRAGHDMDSLLAERHALLADVQELERKVAEAKRYEMIEMRAYALGFRKPSPRQLVIAPPESEEGLLARLLGGTLGSAGDWEEADEGADSDEGVYRVRPRDEVVVSLPGGTEQ